MQSNLNNMSALTERIKMHVNAFFEIKAVIIMTAGGLVPAVLHLSSRQAGITIKSHFPALLSPDAQPIVFEIGKKDIVDVIIGDMFFNPADEADDTIDADGEESADDANDLSFGGERELNALRQKQGDAAASAKAKALQLFKRIRNLEEEQQYSYSVTIPASKATLFNLALRYTLCGTSFRMTYCLHV